MAEQALRETGGNPADAADYLLAMAGGTGLMNRDDIAAAAIGGGPRDLPEYVRFLLLNSFFFRYLYERMKQDH